MLRLISRDTKSQMTKPLRLSALSALVVTTLACDGTPMSPSESVTGHWVAPAGQHTNWWALSLVQTGDRISGIACAGNYLSEGAGIRDVTVSGQYPEVGFVYNTAF